MNYRLDLTVLSETDAKPGCRLALALHNLNDHALHHWSLEFLYDRYIEPSSLQNADIEQIGSFCRLTPHQPLLADNGHFYCELFAQSMPIRFYTDGFKDAALVTSAGERFEVVITPIALAAPYSQKTRLPNVEQSEFALLPMPNHLERYEGELALNKVHLQCHTPLAANAIDWLSAELANQFSCQPSTEHGEHSIHFKLNPSFNASEYRLKVTTCDITIEARERCGFIHASATLLQLLTHSPDNAKPLFAPCVVIRDQPRFQYRGMMLDCARHFHSVAQVKRLINQLARYKFNTFHWHLTDDEAWRIEIKAFPELTQIGAKRGHGCELKPQFSHINDIYQGFYTQEQIKDVIAYADARGISVIPEIDIPGHSRAAIFSLPELLKDPSDHSRYRSVQHYTDNVLSPALPGTYQFLDTVLQEVAALFPAPWIHIGADEVPKGVWSDSQACAELMAKHGYEQPSELQGHLLRYVETKLKALGKRMVGWEEAQHGDKVSKDTVIYSWLSEDAALKCAKQGFDVILQPGQSTYLDMSQDFTPDEPGVSWANVLPLEKCYHYEPLAELTDDDPIRKRILGIQCALWCELVANQQQLDYMLYPRLTAIAEACWTNKSQRDWQDYLARLKAHLPHLDQQGIAYRAPWQ
ncbi:hexosaminidase [Vibrio xiamenensis]|uniref:beta-N-acetylhexosaminidase n=1 Tax=Vibrio xiamenensis TaxID=861298 RepID=A0A1G8HAZ6_9VIBR|nr:family 20 glycosylhydrolase [Vibrio xiamenensis]SDI03817.1 hexosaminidase [Vibrio xiamenensis]